MTARLILTLTFVFAPTAALANPAVIEYVHCSSLSASTGATEVTFMGNFAGRLYFNVTNITWGVPFTQQALLLDTRATSTGLEFKLQSMVHGGINYLSIVNGSSEGRLTSTPGGRDGILLNCRSLVNRI